MSVTAPRTRLRVGKVGERLLRDDAVPKVKGAFDYSSDLSAPGMLWGDTLRSPHAHARVVSIGLSQALALPDGGSGESAGMGAARRAASASGIIAPPPPAP